MDGRLGSAGEFCWMDLKTRDVPGTTAFFSAVLGWRFAVDEADERRATAIFAGGYRIGGASDLANPVYPPGTPPHLALYLAVDDVDRATAAAVARGARLVLAPFDAGSRGRLSTLVDPAGAAFSLWQAREFAGWDFPPGATGAPSHVVLACADPTAARDFYRQVLGTAPQHAEFTAGSTTESSAVHTAPRWELALVVDDLDGVAARVREHGRGSSRRSERAGRSALRMSSPEGVTFHLRPRESAGD